MIIKIVRNIIKESFNLRKKMSVEDVFHHYFKYGDFDGIFIPDFSNEEKLKWLFYQIKSIIDDLRKNNINTGDYLNTSNWGLKQDGNLAMFDIGFGDYFEDFDEEPRELDLKENDTLLDKIKTKLNIKDKSQNIGSGMFGWAHDIGNNRVLKITKDKSEAVNSQKIIGKNLKHLANVFDVKKFKTNDKEYYLIILEKLKTDPNINVLFESLKNFFDDIRNEHLDKRIIEIIKSKNKDVGNFMEDMYKDGYEKTWQKWRETLYKNKELNEKYDFNDISEIVSWIKGSKNNFHDIDEIPPDFIIQLVKKIILGKNTISEQFSGEDYIYHGTGKGQALNIQRDGYMKLNKTGEEKPSISFTKDLDYANYYAKAKGGNNKMAVLRTRLNNDFHLSPRISKNKGEEYITFKKIPSSELEIKTMDGSWKPLNNWNVIFDEPFVV
jgi:hypothetical protein